MVFSWIWTSWKSWAENLVRPISDSKEIQTHNQLVCNWWLDYLAKLIFKHLAFRPVWLIGWVFVYELSGYGLDFRCLLLKFKYCAFFNQGITSYSGSYKV